MTKEELLKREYKTEVYPIETDDGNISWGAKIPELPGCGAGGDTKEEALANLEDAKTAWISFAYDEKRKIPKPKKPNKYSGKFTLRIPKSLHRDLAAAAEQEEESLNKYIMFLLTKSLYKSQSGKQDKKEIKNSYHIYMNTVKQESKENWGIDIQEEGSDGLRKTFKENVFNKLRQKDKIIAN
ncbi:Predicted nuclease of the RNAse H fold, HicB family [Halanaerobium congolense]|uniref:Predicted nuclease of the RNAse H fold, HicB family n=1 Tax=Halanaerobium congolense TaxID=54121 RepID=A0A1I0CK66_9FIRM|nr:type II toxin-antitoxin system HicB family antitoxin [Halanaerobium congolense]PTX14857.1 putative RNase H-like HicB family nuclease [Halanaerobium congolense]SDG02105.1 Predicted nuclease of the RNAse H fold, HicB family [Halanaerobium congolense]SET19962.1 Predicted nuclease of the RNAse H fold, HicB family [Halanaerobium congolense]SFP66824.1 Predicted nuclease of the RNAse H fold, HicB family [Halanaerobium congolense]